MFGEDAAVRTSAGVPAYLVICGNDGLVEGSVERAVLGCPPADGAADCEMLDVDFRLLLL